MTRARPRTQFARYVALPMLAWAGIVPSLLAGESPVLAAGAILQRLAGEYRFTEGPTADDAGNVYFTDPLYPRDYWSRDPRMQQSGQHVYMLAADAAEASPMLTDLEQPNGIIGSLDGQALYVSDIGAGRTYAYDIGADGVPRNKRLFCRLRSDGMTTDNEGNVYLTGKGVTVFDRAGKQIEHIDVPQDWTANVTFGGSGHDLLFITASTAIYGIRMRVRGTLGE